MSVAHVFIPVVTGVIGYVVGRLSRDHSPWIADDNDQSGGRVIEPPNRTMFTPPRPGSGVHCDMAVHPGYTPSSKLCPTCGKGPCLFLVLRETGE